MRANLGFLDESGISLRPNLRRTWAPKGQTPILKAEVFALEKRSVIGLIKCTPSGRKPKLYLRIFKKTISSKEVIRFFKELRRHIKGKLILLWDRLPAHQSKATKEHIDKQKSWLQVEYFPPYAPELNPVEYLWSSGKNKDLANLYAETGTEIDKAIKQYGRRVRGSPNLLKGFLKVSTLFNKELAS